MREVSYNCDICGTSMPEEGIILMIQDNRLEDIIESEEAFDLCDNCYSRLKTFLDINSKKE